MLSPGGAFRFELPAAFDENPAVCGIVVGVSFSFVAVSTGASPGLAVCCNRISIRCLCCSRTERLRCNCSRMFGSCVTKPGERQASPTS